MSKGELPVPHIIAIVLGIVVLALLGYWFFSQGGIFGGATTEATCRSKLLQYCIAWSACNYEDACRPGGSRFYEEKNSKECTPHKKQLSKDIDDVTETCRELFGQSSGETGETKQGGPLLPFPPKK